VLQQLSAFVGIIQYICCHPGEKNDIFKNDQPFLKIIDMYISTIDILG